MPIIQLRANAVGSEVKWDMAYPGDTKYTPLHRNTILLDLEALVRTGVVKVEQVHPAECFRTPFCPSQWYPRGARTYVEPTKGSYTRLHEPYIPLEEIEFTGPWAF